MELTLLTDDELARLADAVNLEQVERQKIALRAERNQWSMFLPNRLYVR